MFVNRSEAGYLLAERLQLYKNNKQAVVVAIPRGGVPIGYVIASNLHLPLEVVLSKKIGHPFNKEFAIGAVTLESRILSDAAIDVSESYIENETKKVRALLKQRQQQYYGLRKPIKLSKKIVIIIDDGIATGNTLLSCIELIQQQKPLEIIVALPVAPPNTFDKIKKVPAVNKAICLVLPRDFYAVGQFYKEFYQVTDNEVVDLILKAQKELNLHQSNT